MKIESCPNATMTNVTKFRHTNTIREYAQPGGRSLVNGRAIQTPDFE
jgi:hypothetical protein